MKKKKIIFLLTLLIIVTTSFSMGITSHSKSQQENPIKIWFQNENGSVSTYNVVDEKTGVNYIVVKSYAKNYGNGISTSVSIVPRYNKDGSLYVSK